MSIDWVDIDSSMGLAERKNVVFCAGNIIRFADGEVVLVGNINEQAGWCGCCEDLRTPIAYAKLVDMSNLASNNGACE